MIHIRSMNIEDYDPVTALWEATEGVGLNESDTREAIEVFLKRNPRMSAVALDDSGRIVGAVLCGHDGRRGYLHHLAVAPAHRRRGVARALLNHCYEHLRGEGVTRCSIFLYADNHEGHAFWLHDGFFHRAELAILQRRLTEDAAGAC